MSAVKEIEFTQIAAAWDSIKLGEETPRALLAIRNGLTTKQNQDKGDFKVSRIETIGGGWIDETRVRFVSDLKQKDVEKYRIQKGDILFSHINSDPHLGKTGFAEKDYEDLLHGMNLLLIRANPEVFEAEFLNRVFQYYRDIGVFISICSRSVNQSSINQAKLKAVEVPLPPLAEQKKIAHILSTVQRAIEAQERIIQTTTELKKTLMHKLFTEGLRNEPQKQTEIGAVPESWKVVPLSDVIRSKLQNGAFVQKPETGKGILFANVVDMYRETHLDLSRLERLDVSADSIAQYWLEDGDILVVRSSLKREGIGQNCVARNLSESVFYDCHLIRVQTDERKLVPEFLSTFWRSDIGKNDLVLRSKTTTMTTINQQGISKALIPIASIEEQSEIVGLLEIVDTKIRGHRTQKHLLEDLLRTLLHELMTAKTRVHELEISA